MNHLRHIILAVWLISALPSVVAQTLTQAKTWYLNRDFQKALPVFKKQLALKPKDPNLNFWYGACLMETGKFNEAKTYIEFANSKSIPDALYYLAWYFFDEQKQDSALSVVTRYLNLPNLNKQNREVALELKTTIENALEQYRKVEDVVFIDSIVVPKSQLYSSLKISKEAGSISPVRTTFTDLPKASAATYLPEKNDRALYASAVPEKGLDLVVRHRILEEWDGEEALPDIINTQSDEINPWLLADGTTLYFASNRPGSMGGYDLYLTRMGKNSTYLLPDHLNMPYNSPANDYFLVLDEFANRGYLATDRNQPKGMVVIYTFIPPSTPTLVQGKSLNELQDLATIKSIRDTWKGKNMDSLLLQPARIIRTATNKGNGVAFVLNDAFTCYRKEDFTSDEAGTLYDNLQFERIRYQEAQTKLSELRTQYLQSDSTQKSALSKDITTLEQEILAYEKALPLLEARIRNLEIAARTK